MTSIDRTPVPASPQGPQLRASLLKWLTAVTALSAIVATVVLLVIGNAEAATSVAVIGAAALGVGGIQVTIQIRR
ncbi:hypothetical protein ABZZ17_18555 [Streptomyces sp. NPDC006512]|uniref:hypothetical protein n=1 Tax=Streptomyces sp. NPDC006512 TaxID=3154307 RepID=UPI0033A3ABA0